MSELVALLAEALAKLKDKVDAIVIPEAIKGDKGDKGEQGIAGKNGKDGKDGKNGIDGKDGAKGEKGDQGERGADGINGKDGKDGLNGRDGIDGKDGKDGLNGRNGVDGLTIKGDKGDKGDIPKHEWKGTSLRFELPNGQWGKYVDLEGRAGLGSRFLGGASGIQTLTSTDGSMIITADGQNVDITVSQDSPASNIVKQVRNETGSTLLKGTVVYINGASGNKATVTKAIATGDATSAQTLGMITTDIATNQNGYVTVFGQITGIDTSMYADGAQLYLSSTVAGSVTATKQYAPAHLVYVGIVTRSHQNQGAIEVNIQNGYELEELHNVAINFATLANDDSLFYDAATGLWKNKAGGGGGGSGTVTSVALSAPTGFTVSGSPVTSTGTLTLSFATGYSLPSDVTQGTWNTAYSWGNHATAGYLTSINSSMITTALGFTPYSAANPNGYISSYTETDPIFVASVAYSITNTQVTNWDAAYDWGNHASVGYLTSYTETDPIFVAHAAYNVTNTKITNWDTAYSWGNHAVAGYLTSSSIGSSVQAYSINLTGWAAITTASKQDALVSGTNIKTINGRSLLGNGELIVNSTQTALTFDLSTAQNFECTPSAGGVITFTSHAKGKSGFVLLNNTGNFIFTKASTTKSDVLFLADISTTGIYLIHYYDDGTNTYVYTTEALS